MAALPILSPRERQVGGCCTPVVHPDLAEDRAIAFAATMKALGDPTRLQIVDAIRKAAPEAICQCELTPLFDMSQQALSKHLEVLITAGILGRERRGLWAYYYIEPDGLEEVITWLT